MSAPIRLALIGMGKIAHDQHVPAIAGEPAIALAATVSRNGEGVEGVPHFHDIADLIASGQGIDAVALCTPPQVRRAIAMQAIQAGWHVFLEKPPGATLAEVANLEAPRRRRASPSSPAGIRATPPASNPPAPRWPTRGSTG